MATSSQKAKLSDYGNTQTPPQSQKKHRLSRLLGGSSSSRYSNNNTGSYTESDRPTASVLHDDSAYGSADSERKHDIIQVENDGTIPNTNRSQNLALDRGTGEVFDEESGEVVTVVTTTTTTTTTTTSKPGNRGNPEVRKDVMTTQQEHNPATGNTVMTAGPAGAPGVVGGYDYKPPGPTRDSTYASQSTTGSDYTATPYDSHNQAYGSNVGSLSPNRQNFSYPSRATPTTAAEARYDEAGHVPTKKTSRLADLKAVAVGLHGVGETLRGTINSTIDDRYARKDPAKAAAIREHNQSVLDRGRAEMSGIPHRPRQDQYGSTIGRTDSAASGYPSASGVYSTTSNTSNLNNPTTTGAYHASNTGYGTNTSGSTTYGPHDSNMANKLDPRVDSNLDGKSGLGRSGTVGTNYTSGTTGSSVYSSNAYDNNYDNSNSSAASNNLRSATYGPHDSNLANKVDPRVDSDRDGSKTVGSHNNTSYGSSTTGTGYNNNNTSYGSGTTGYGNNSPTASGSGVTGRGYNNDYNSPNTTGQGNDPRSSNYGPHSSNIANKLDPRVDSDLDGSKTTGNNKNNNTSSYGSGVTGTGYNNNTSTYGSGTGYNNNSAYGSSTGYNSNNNNSALTTGQGNDPRSSNYGPHSSNLANRLDPRVDSDLDGSRTTGNNSNNRESSDMYGSGQTGRNASNDNYNSADTTNQGNNPRSSNYGPHGSNIANVLDPRVDSDLDGSKTVGNNKNNERNDNTNTGFGSTTSSGYGNNSNTGYNTTSNTGYGNNSSTGYSTNNNKNTSSAYNSSNNTNQPNDPRSTNYGPHSSNVLNKLDPRVDSDQDGSRTAGNSNNSHNNTASSGYNTSATGYNYNNNTYDNPSPSISNDSRDRLGYQAPRGTAVRMNSESAPESVSGIPERGDSNFHAAGHHGLRDTHNNTYNAAGNNYNTRNDDYNNTSQTSKLSSSPGTGSYSSTGSADTFDTQTRENTNANTGVRYNINDNNTHNTTGSGLSGTNTTLGSTAGTAGPGSGLGSGTDNVLSDRTNTANDGYTSGGEKKTSTLGKLFKRKPVGGNNTDTSSSERKFY